MRVGRDHLAQQRDDLRVGDQRAAARAGEAVGLGQRAQDREIRQLVQSRASGRSWRRTRRRPRRRPRARGPPGARAMRTIAASSSSCRSGCWASTGTPACTSWLAAREHAPAHRARSRAPRRSGTLRTSAPWMRARDGVHAEGRRADQHRSPGRRGRTRAPARSMASSLPRPDEQAVRARRRRARPGAATSACGCGSGIAVEPGAASRSSSARHGSSLACSRSRRGSHARVLVGLRARRSRGARARVS